jgi:hypothetical protein
LAGRRWLGLNKFCGDATRPLLPRDLGSTQAPTDVGLLKTVESPTWGTYFHGCRSRLRQVQRSGRLKHTFWWHLPTRRSRYEVDPLWAGSAHPINGPQIPIFNTSAGQWHKARRKAVNSTASSRHYRLSTQTRARWVDCFGCRSRPLTPYFREALQPRFHHSQPHARPKCGAY